MRLFYSSIALCFLSSASFAQLIEPKAPTVQDAGNGMMSFTWPTENNHFYFSSQSTDLSNWTFIPEVWEGNGSDASITMGGASKIFFRAYASNLSYTGPVEHADPDGDGLSVIEELRDNNTSPADSDTDGDGVSDAEEDIDGDGYTSLEEIRYIGTSPKVANPELRADSDGDGIEDGFERIIIASSENDPYTSLASIALSNVNTASGLHGRKGSPENGGPRLTAEGELENQDPPLNLWTEWRLIDVFSSSSSNQGNGAWGRTSQPDTFVSQSGGDSVSGDIGERTSEARSRYAEPFPSDSADEVLSENWLTSMFLGSPLVGQISSEAFDDGNNFQGHKSQIRLVADRPIEQGEPPYKQSFLKIRRTLTQTPPDPDTIEILETVELEIPVGEDKSPLLELKADSYSNNGFRDGFIPVDLDIVHPATGELNDGREDHGDGGYVAIKREATGVDEAPVTKIKIHATLGLGNGAKVRLKFNSGGRYFVYQDQMRTQLVTSETTEFLASQETVLYLKGEEKSLSRGGELITQQVKVGNTWMDGDSVKFTVVPAVFDVWLNVFIPNEWIDIPFPHPVHTGGRRINGGDGRGFDSSYSFAASGRVTSRSNQRIKLIPYEDLNQDGVLGMYETRADNTVLLFKSGSVTDPNAGPSSTNKLLPTPSVDRDVRNSNAGAKGNLLGKDTKRDVKYQFRGRIDNPTVDPSAAINWDFQFKVITDDPLRPQLELLGNQHDKYPGYELYTRANDQDDAGKVCYTFDPREEGTSAVWLLAAWPNEDIIPGQVITIDFP